MCYLAQIWADFKKYERFGGKLNIKEFIKLAGWKEEGQLGQGRPKGDATSHVANSRFWPVRICVLGGGRKHSCDQG